MWESYWERFIDELSENECIALVRRMGLPVPGFRKGARNIPITKARRLLKDAPSRGNGKPFLEWFRKEFGDLLTDLEQSSDGSSEENIEKYVEEYPVGILRVALAMTRPELLKRWHALLEQREVRQGELQARNTVETLEEKISVLKERLASREQELEEARRREKWLDQEKRKLEYKIRELNEQITKLERETAAELARLQAELGVTLQTIQSLQADNERLRQENESLATRVTRYRNARKQDEALLQFYRSLVDPSAESTDDVEQAVLVIGVTFPVQYVRLLEQTVRIEAIAPPAEVDDEFLSFCSTFDSVVVLSSCPHKVRLRLRRVLGRQVTEIGGLSEFGNLFREES